MIKKILNHKLMIKNPPVIIDLGASGESYDTWKKIYSHSIFIALDGDDRKKINYKNKFKKYIPINKIIDKKKNKRDFYLTKSPYCSSLLKPSKKTREWFFHDQFKVTKKKTVKTTTLNEILKIKKIKKIDILKIDLQGIDLEVFKSISKKITKNIKFIDIEPSLYGFYELEKNNVSETIKHMEKEFFVEDIKFGKHIKGNISNVNNLGFLKKKINLFH